MKDAPSGFVLLHGLAGSVAGWDAVADGLSRHGDVRAPQLPWHGLADDGWTRTPDLDGQLSRHIRPGDVVVAHSFAAALALAELTQHTRTRPGALVLVSPFFRSEPADFDWATMAHFMTDFHLLLAGGVRAASRRSIDDDLLHDMAVAVRNRISPYGWMAFFRSYLATATLPLSRLDCPVVIVHGDDDDVAPVDGARELHRRLPDSSLRLVARGGHFPMLLTPDAIVSAALEAAGLATAAAAAHSPARAHALAQEVSA